ncbi:GroES-like protein [Annulohypoxylon bovei var. microspora]|nr:GroES-like protein [Annulohypoxylon bovei var. microspora]
MAPENSAAWLPDKCVRPLQIGPAPYTPPKAGEIVVRNHAVAINPVDWIKQSAGNAIMGYIKYPCILGGDVAGEVVEVGPDVERFQIGDRVIGQAAACAPTSNNPVEGAFQHYTLIREHLAVTIPDFMSYEEAVVLPLAALTAACGLFHQDFLALDPPTVPATPLSANKAVIVTGGASSVGSNAIQLAVSAGYQVYSTASPKNFAYVEKLGATKVFDYHSAVIVDDMVAALKGKTVAGAFVVGDGAAEDCTKVLRQLGGSANKFIAFAGSIVPPDALDTSLGTAKLMGGLIFWFGQRALVSCLTGVRTKFVEDENICQPDNVASRLVFRDFLPKALEARQFVPAPEPLVVGRGLEKIQEAMDLQKKGVSAKKIVVLL